METKELLLTNNQYTIVNSSLHHFLSSFKWRLIKNYPATTIDNKTIRLHRFIMMASPKEEIDHIDGNPLNNTISNLRRCTRWQNSCNRKFNTLSGFKGLVFIKSLNKWRAQIRVHGKLLYLGFYVNPKEAALAYDKAARKYFGEFSRTNYEN